MNAIWKCDKLFKWELKRCHVFVFIIFYLFKIIIINTEILHCKKKKSKVEKTFKHLKH